MTTAIYQNRVEDKEKVERELGFPEEGYTKSLYIDNLLFAQGYERIVYGDHGPYIEFSREQIVATLKSKYGSYIPKLPDESYKYFYLWLCPIEAPDVKVYWQIKPVTYLKNAPEREDGKPSRFNREEGYADYRRGYYYVSPYSFK